jgi:hypothetical protein
MAWHTLSDLMNEYYRPYETLPAFHQGFAAYRQHRFKNPYDGLPHKSVEAQAWDRGLECAARWAGEHYG